jgi:hypothetical protein
MSQLPTVANPTRKLYPSDMSDAEWALIEPKLPAPKGFVSNVNYFGGSRQLDWRVNAL